MTKSSNKITISPEEYVWEKITDPNELRRASVELMCVYAHSIEGKPGEPDEAEIGTTDLYKFPQNQIIDDLVGAIVETIGRGYLTLGLSKILFSEVEISFSYPAKDGETISVGKWISDAEGPLRAFRIATRPELERVGFTFEGNRAIPPKPKAP